MQKRKKTTQTSRFFGTRLIVGLLVLIATLLVVLGLISRTTNIKLFTVLSGCMEPAIKIGSLVITNPSDTYQIGEIITFYENDRDITVTHRIVNKETTETGYRYTTQGDANESPDTNPVYENQIIGKLVFRLLLFGYIVNFAHTQIGFTLMVVIPCTIMIYNEVLKIKTESQKILTARKEKVSKSKPKLELMSIFVIPVVVFTLFGLSVSTASATDLKIECTHTECNTSPSNAPIFREFNLKPTEATTRELEICNQTTENLSMNFQIINLLSQPISFAEQIYISIFIAETNQELLSPRTIKNLDREIVPLINKIEPNQCQNLVFFVNLNNLNNSYQGSNISFDINWITEVTEKTNPEVLSSFIKTSNQIKENVFGSILPLTGSNLILTIIFGLVLITAGLTLKILQKQSRRNIPK